MKKADRRSHGPVFRGPGVRDRTSTAGISVSIAAADEQHEHVAAEQSRQLAQSQLPGAASGDLAANPTRKN